MLHYLTTVTMLVTLHATALGNETYNKRPAFPS